MKKRSELPEAWDALREKIIGLGERSVRKNHSPELQQQYAELKRFRQLLDQSSELILVFDVTSLQVVDANETACELLERTRDHLLGACLAELHPAFSETVLDAIAKPGQSVPTRVVYAGADGTARTLDGWIKVVTVDDQQTGMLIVRDISDRIRAETALQESETKYRRLYESMRDAFASADMAGKLQEFNPAYQTMLGYSAEELRQLTYQDLTPEKWHGFEAGIVEKQVLARGYSDVYAKEYRRKDGVIFPVELRAFLMRDAANQPTGMWAIVRDVTERKRVEEALQKQILALTQPLDESTEIQFTDLFNLEDVQRIQDAFAEATGVASLITHADGVPITQPSNFCRLCSEVIRKTEKGLSRCMHSDAMIGRYNPSGPTIQACLSAGLFNAGASITVGGKYIANWLIGQAKSEAPDETSLLRYAAEIGVDPMEFRAALAEVPVMSKDRFEKIAGALFLLSNELSLKAYQNVQQARFIAERQRAEAELQRHREHLEELVAERTAALERSNIELRQAMTQLVQSEKLAALGNLVAGVAHELNTPLGNARIVASALDEHLREFTAAVESGALRRSQVTQFLDRGRQAVELLERNTVRAADLINHFKQIAVDQTSMRRRLFNLRQTAEEVLVTLRPSFKRTAHRIEVEIPPHLELDSYPGSLEQVITNLVTNSLTHGFEGVEAGCIQLQAQAVGPAHVALHYADNGVGIPATTLNRIFEPFFTTRLGHGGSGLGLYIVHNLVTGALGGTIEVRSTVGQGLSFTFTLPLKAPQRQDTAIIPA